MNHQRRFHFNLVTVPLLALLPLVCGQTASAEGGGTTTRTGNLPLIRSSHGGSLNWSGYAVGIPNVTSVSGTFTVPDVDSPGSVGGLPANVSAWVGIDGYTSGTVEQVGISGSYDDTTGAATYSAWWEMYPRVSSTIQGMTILAGDSITAGVIYNGGGSYTVAITDNTSGQVFTKAVSVPVNGPDAALRNSAEWVVERAATISNGYLTILPLTTFGQNPETPLTFSDGSFTGGGATVTLQEAIDAFAQFAGYPSTPPAGRYWERIIMMDLDSTGAAYPLDDPSKVSRNTFQTSFLANGKPFPIPGVYRH